MERTKIIEALRAVQPTVLLGIDGMIDEVWELLASRSGPGQYTKMTRLMEFGDAITERVTGGLAKERLLKRRTNGGFVCNTGRATATLGAPTTLLGMFGEQRIDSVFDEFQGLAELISVGEPVRLHILEFQDGKIMMPDLDELINLKWQDLVKRLGEARLRKLCAVDIMGVGYWSNLYDFEEIMTALVTDYLQNGRTKRVFHDFANLNKRSGEALDRALELLGRLNAVLPQTLSLNEHEGGIMARHFGIAYPERVNAPESESAVLDAAVELQQRTGLDEVVIHTLFCAAAATAAGGAVSVPQDHCRNAVKTTGAGDTFNGGYMVASLTDIPLDARLRAANATTRYYVEHAAAPTREQLIAQMEQSGF
ncbi:MAG: carbohydrate kinase family protein [Clostridia bacterium]|nr:carbohydrate kinase family protein [Clostridia bacterium]